MKKMDCTKMGADKWAKNTPNAPIFICPNCLSKPKSLGFRKKGLHWASIVRGKHITTEAERVIQYNKRKKKHERRNGFWDKCIRSSSNRILT